MPIQYIHVLLYWWDNDRSDKTINKHMCQGYSVCLLLFINPLSLSTDNFLFQIITKGCKNDRMGLVHSPASCTYACRKALKINAKIEDVGLNED